MERPLYRAHPWHGLSCRTEDPSILHAYIEVVPTDAVKYEIDKPTGILRVDRPQKYSSTCPTLYGFLPRTLCGDRFGDHVSGRISRPVRGDGDPLDICVLTERAFSHGDLLVSCVPLGGLRMIDQDQADDKIVAVLVGDAAYGHYTDIDQIPAGLVARLEHYFLSYKQFPAHQPSTVKLEGLYGAGEALQLLHLAETDYALKFP